MATTEKTPSVKTEMLEFNESGVSGVAGVTGGGTGGGGEVGTERSHSKKSGKTSAKVGSSGKRKVRRDSPRRAGGKDDDVKVEGGTAARKRRAMKGQSDTVVEGGAGKVVNEGGEVMKESKSTQTKEDGSYKGSTAKHERKKWERQVEVMSKSEKEPPTKSEQKSSKIRITTVGVQTVSEVTEKKAAVKVVSGDIKEQKRGNEKSGKVEKKLTEEKMDEQIAEKKLKSSKMSSKHDKETKVESSGKQSKSVKGKDDVKKSEKKSGSATKKDGDPKPKKEVKTSEQKSKVGEVIASDYVEKLDLSSLDSPEKESPKASKQALKAGEKKDEKKDAKMKEESRDEEREEENKNEGEEEEEEVEVVIVGDGEDMKKYRRHRKSAFSESNKEDLEMTVSDKSVSSSCFNSVSPDSAYGSPSATNRASEEGGVMDKQKDRRRARRSNSVSISSSTSLMSPEVKPWMHMLTHEWSLWWYRNERGHTWEENLVPIQSFKTIEEFWCLFNHLVLPSVLPSGQDYLIFKHGIKPMWENKYNVRGGRWVINLSRQQRYDPVFHVDTLWLETLLCLIGEAFEQQTQEVCGAVVNVRSRQGDKLAIWLRNADHVDGNQIVARRWKERLGINVNQLIGFEAHQDTMAKAQDPNCARFLYQA